MCTDLLDNWQCQVGDKAVDHRGCWLLHTFNRFVELSLVQLYQAIA